MTGESAPASHPGRFSATAKKTDEVQQVFLGKRNGCVSPLLVVYVHQAGKALLVCLVQQTLQLR
jgi:hypothetical protein